MRKKARRAGVVLMQSGVIWMIGWGCCIGISRLMCLLGLEG